MPELQEISGNVFWERFFVCKAMANMLFDFRALHSLILDTFVGNLQYKSCVQSLNVTI